MTVQEYLNFASELKKLDKSMRKTYVEEAMDMAGITEMKGRLIRNLSKGYRQRVGLAQAILGYPQVIILDEPTVGLDPKQIIEMRELIKKLGKKHTVILSSHILSEVREVCDYIFIISQGRLVASDSTEHLLTQMEGSGHEFEIVLSGEEERAEELLAEREEIEEVTVQEENPDGGKHLLIKTSGEEDLRNELIRLLIEHEIPVVEFYTAGKSLEDIFLELTNQKGEL